MKERINNFIKRLSKREIRLSQKAYIFLFCLLLSTFFWFLASLSKQYVTTLNASLTYSELPENFILTDSPPEQISLIVNGSGFDLLGEQMSLNRKVILVDLDKAKTLGTLNRYFIPTKLLKDKIVSNLNSGIEFMDIVEDTLFLKTEKRLSKEIKVQPKVDLKFEKAYKQRGAIKVIPEIVRISGPEEFIDSINHIYTEILKKDKLKDTTTVTVKIDLPKNINGVAVLPTEVEVFIPVEKYTEKVLILPIRHEFVNNTSAGELQTFPDQVEIAVLLPLSKFNNVDASLLKATVRYGEGENHKKKLDVHIDGLPNYGILTKVEPERVEYILKK